MTHIAPHSTFSIDLALLSPATPLLSINNKLGTHKTGDQEGQEARAGIELGDGPELNGRVNRDTMQVGGE